MVQLRQEGFCVVDAWEVRRGENQVQVEGTTEEFADGPDVRCEQKTTKLSIRFLAKVTG